MAVKWARARRASRVRRSSSAPFHAGSAARTHKSESACQPVRPTTARGADAPNRGRSDRSHSPDPPTDEPGRAISVLGVSVARRIRRPPPGRLHASTAWECHEFGPEISARVKAASLVDQWLTRVHALVPRAVGGRSTRMLERHTAVRRLGERSSSPTPWQIGRASRCVAQTCSARGSRYRNFRLLWRERAVWSTSSTSGDLNST